MKGIAVFLGLLIIASTAAALSLDAGAVSACGTPAGCPLSALASAYGVLVTSITGSTDLVITSAQPATVTVPANLRVSTIVLQGQATLNVEKNARLVAAQGLAVAQNAKVTVFGYLETANNAAGGNANTIISGALDIAASATVILQYGLDVATTGTVTLASGANLQVSNAASAVDGIVVLASAAVLAYTQTTVTLVGGIYGTASSYATATRATIIVTATASFTSTLNLTGDAVVKVQAVAVFAAGIVVTGANNGIETASGLALRVKGDILVAAGAALTAAGKFIADNRVKVYGNLTVIRGNGTDAPTLEGGIWTSVGSRMTIGVDTTLIAKAKSDIEGAVVLFAGATYNAQVAAHTIALLLVQAAGAVVLAADATTVLITRYLVDVYGSVSFIGAVTALANV